MPSGARPQDVVPPTADRRSARHFVAPLYVVHGPRTEALPLAPPKGVRRYVTLTQDIAPRRGARHIDAPLDVVGQRTMDIPPLAAEGGCDNLSH